MKLNFTISKISLAPNWYNLSLTFWLRTNYNKISQVHQWSFDRLKKNHWSKWLITYVIFCVLYHEIDLETKVVKWIHWTAKHTQQWIRVMMKSVLEKCLSKRLKMDVFYQVDSLKLCLKTTSPLRNCFVLYKFPGN